MVTARASTAVQHACTVNMMLAGGGDYVSVKVYSNGKTQVRPTPSTPSNCVPTPSTSPWRTTADTGWRTTAQARGGPLPWPGHAWLSYSPVASRTPPHRCRASQLLLACACWLAAASGLLLLASQLLLASDDVAHRMANGV
jgi:hypothetical protein